MEFWLATYNVIADIMIEIIGIFYQSSIFILFGLLFSGIMHEFIPMKLITRNLGQKGIKGIFWATILGAPLPLCSCSVLPAAATLRKKGASKSATASFIVSVPETGVDSVIVSYGLLGPVMAVYRPIAAIMSAIAAGLSCAFLTRGEKDDAPLSKADEDKLEDLSKHHHHAHDHNHDHHHHHHGDLSGSENIGLKNKAKGVFRYGFGPMLDDIAFWIVVGLTITGIMLALVPDNFFSTGEGLFAGILSMLIMVLISVPLYTCASMSTPVAAGLIVSGLSPGAALVYLLTGPATSIATINIVGKMLGFRVMWAYLSSIIVVAICFGLALDYFAADIVRADAIIALNSSDSTFWMIVKGSAAVIFVGLVIMSFGRKSYIDPVNDLKNQASLFGGFLKTHQRKIAGAGGVLLIALLLPFYTLQVPPDSKGMILRFGKVVDKDLSPGFYFRLPSPITETVVISTDNVRQISVEDAAGERGISARENSNTYLTADENIVLIKSVVTYEVDDIYEYHFYSEQNDSLLKNIAKQVLVSETVQLPIDAVFTTERESLEQRFRDRLERKVEDLEQGFRILDARLVYVHAPNRVHDAFRDVASSLEDFQRKLFLANGDAISMLNDASGESARIKADADVNALNELARAKGDAAGFKPLAEVHSQYPYLTEKRLHLEAQERSLILPKLYLNGLKNSEGVDLWLDPNAEDVVRFKFKD